MKRFLNRDYLPFAALLLGLLTAGLRLWFFSQGRDAAGLLPNGTVSDILSWILVAIAIPVAFLGSRLPEGDRRSLPNATQGALGTVLTAISFLIAVILELGKPADLLRNGVIVLGFLSVVCLLLIAWCRFIDTKPHMLLHTVVSLFLVLCLISRYRIWSAYPQLQNYAFSLLAIVFAMIAAYQRTALVVDTALVKQERYLFFSACALFFSVAALPGCDNLPLFLGCAVWMFFTPCPPKPQEPEEAAEEV